MLLHNFQNRHTLHLLSALTLLIVVIASGAAALFPEATISILVVSLLLFVFLIARSVQFDLLLWACLLAYTFVQFIPALESLRFILLFSLTLFSVFSTKGVKIRMNNIAMGLGLVSIYSMLAALQSFFPTVALFKSISLLLLATFLITAPSAIKAHYPHENVRGHIMGVYFSFSILIILSSAIYYFLEPSSSNEYFSGTSFMNGRFRGWFVNPNDFAAVCGIFVIPILWFRTVNQRGVLQKIGLSVVFILAMIELLLTQSRSGILAGALSLLSVMLANRKWGTRIVILAGLVLSLLLIYFSNPNENLLRQFIYRNEIQLAGSGRLSYWNAALDRFFDKPLLGSGLGVSNSSANAAGVVFSALAYKKQIDNSYLSVLEELGIVGTLLVTIFLLLPLCTKTWRLFSQPRLSTQRFNQIYGAVIIAGLFNAVFEGWLFSVGSLIGLSFWIFAALFMFEDKHSNPQSDQTNMCSFIP